METGPELKPAAVRTALRDALLGILGSETDDVLPEYPSRNVGELKGIGKTGRFRLRRLFELEDDGDVSGADDADLARGVARACEDLLVALSGLENRLDAVAAHGSIEADASKEALLRHPLVKNSLAAASDTISRLSELGARPE